MPLVSSLIALSMAGPSGASPTELHRDVATTIRTWSTEGRPGTLDAERAGNLAPLIDWLAQQQSKGEPAPLVFVCTHNSRRSQMGQAWARAAALELGIEQVTTWSGGTESTAFNPRAVAALRSHGFAIEETGEMKGDVNVVYTLGYGPGVTDTAFSKVYSHDFNPKSGFAAVMVCSSADASCPFVEGADVRISLPYLDPKVSDGTPEEAATYRAKSEEIGREMVWLMQSVAQRAKK